MPSFRHFSAQSFEPFWGAFSIIRFIIKASNSPNIYHCIKGRLKYLNMRYHFSAVVTRHEIHISSYFIGEIPRLFCIVLNPTDARLMHSTSKFIEWELQIGFLKIFGRPEYFFFRVTVSFFIASHNNLVKSMYPSEMANLLTNCLSSTRLLYIPWLKEYYLQSHEMSSQCLDMNLGTIKVFLDV